jgi:uncharacterized protein (DUF1778 family)
MQGLKHVQIKLTEKEWKLLSATAKKHGETLQNFARTAVMSRANIFSVLPVKGAK